MSSSPSFPNDALRPSLPPTSQGPRQQPEQQIPKPKVILLLHPDKQNHGLLQKLKRHADLVKFTNLETSDAVYVLPYDHYLSLHCPFKRL
jgi:hypothetical protein